MKNDINLLTGKEYWRSLDQLADAPKFRRFLEQEFPESLPEMNNPISRRKFLSVMGASMALAGLAGCRKPVEKIIPYVSQPEEVIPGVPSYYATTMPFGSSAYGLIVECHEGRPTKIEGNPLHPSTLGRSNAYMQAEILNLYDPDRSKKVLHNGAESSWDEFVAFWRQEFAASIAAEGKNLAVIIAQFSSPTLSRLAKRYYSRRRGGQFVTHEPINDWSHLSINAIEQIGLYRLDHHYDKANVILSLDSDFLQSENADILAARRFTDGRRIDGINSPMNRLYVVEPDLTATGAMADHRLRLPRSMMEYFLAALIYELKPLGIKIPNESFAEQFAGHPFRKEWIKTLAKDLAENRGRCLVAAGRAFRNHMMIRLINEALGNIGKTVTFVKAETETASEISASEASHISTIEVHIDAGIISTLVCIGSNPVYSLDGSSRLQNLLAKVKHLIHFGSHVDETAQQAEWHIPRAHFLESWGDTRATDGTLGLIQPMIQPLYNGIGDAEFLNLMATGEDKRGYEIVRETWQKILKGGDFEKKWRQVLHDGVYKPDQRQQEVSDYNRYELDAILTGFSDLAGANNTLPSKDKLELTFQPSATLYDGRYANNGWLQELPHAVNKLTWDNAACVSPKTARELGLKNGDVVSVANQYAAVELPVWIVPGQADYTISVELGYGRTAAGQVGTGVGVNVYPLRPNAHAHYVSGVKISKTGKAYKLASTQDHGAMEGRPIVREADLDTYREHPDFARKMVDHPPLVGIYPEHDYSTGYQWGMTIDLNACIGCNACTIACQSENNIPVVGKARVLDGREMHWIRVDRYFSGDVDDPDMVFMPMPCQQCENAPCESVCPVSATVHDREGLNVMTYNRCIGTRYCSNNCPYKVRRFNFFNYTSRTPEVVKMAMNPDVTVRSRGVMEKCTFCTQRIQRAKIIAKRENRKVRDGEIRTACQQACPADAIVFGNINNPDSRVAKIKGNNRSYDLLAELNTKPRNSYLARIRNRHPRLQGTNSPHHTGGDTAPEIES